MLKNKCNCNFLILILLLLTISLQASPKLDQQMPLNEISQSENYSPPLIKEPKKSSQGFNYLRFGGFSLLWDEEFSLGGEISIGHRYRTESWGYGPNLNISFCSYALPAISLKYESLFYPKSLNGTYFGLMPSIGVVRNEEFRIFSSSKPKKMRWYFPIPNLELIVGKESLGDKKTFYYFSISPFLIFSLNYGVGF